MTAPKAAEPVTTEAAPVAPKPVPVVPPAPVLGWQVVGVNAVYGTKPGEFIERSLTPEEIKFLKGANAIALTEKGA